MTRRVSRRAALSLVVGAAIAPTAARAQGTPEPAAANVLRRYVEAVYANRDLGALDTLVAEGIEPQDPGDASGRDALRQRLTDELETSFYGDVAMTLEAIIANEAQACARVSLRRATVMGAPEETGDMLIHAHVTDGLISRLWSLAEWYRT